MKRWKDSFRVRLRFRIRNRIRHHHSIIFTLHRNSDIAIIRSGAFFTSSTVLATGTTPARPAPNRTEVYYACRFVQRVRPQYKRMKTDFRPTAFPPLSLFSPVSCGTGEKMLSTNQNGSTLSSHPPVVASRCSEPAFRGLSLSTWSPRSGFPDQRKLKRVNDLQPYFLVASLFTALRCPPPTRMQLKLYPNWNYCLCVDLCDRIIEQTAGSVGDGHRSQIVPLLFQQPRTKDGTGGRTIAFAFGTDTCHFADVHFKLCCREFASGVHQPTGVHFAKVCPVAWNASLLSYHSRTIKQQIVSVFLFDSFHRIGLWEQMVW